MLCRIYNKKGTIEKQGHVSHRKATSLETIEEKKPEVMAPPPAPSPAAAAGTVNDYVYFDTSDSVPKFTDSSCSEQVVSPEFTSEVQSQPKWKDWEPVNALDYSYNYVDAPMDNPFASQLSGNNEMSPLQDMFMYLQKPF